MMKQAPSTTAGRDFFAAEFRTQVVQAVREVENQTSAEVVIAVKPDCGSYRVADYRFGLVLSVALLCVFLYHPTPFDFTFLPLELSGAFGLGVILSASTPGLRRSLSSASHLALCAQQAAKACFFDLGVHRTRERTGILLTIAPFERTCIVLTDSGVPTDKVPEWQSWQARVRVAARANATGQLVGLVRELGPMLKDHLPTRSDDINELSDEPVELKTRPADVEGAS